LKTSDSWQRPARCRRTSANRAAWQQQQHRRRGR
jgi:hypothetical protein